MISSKMPNPLPIEKSMREKMETLEKLGNTTIWRPHGEEYRTSEWYTGSGEITSGSFVTNIAISQGATGVGE